MGAANWVPANRAPARKDCGQLPETKQKKDDDEEKEVGERERDGSPVTHKVLLVEESKVWAKEGVDASARLAVVENLQLQIFTLC